jgi:sugar phosphate isomerase/epimerase
MIIGTMIKGNDNPLKALSDLHAMGFEGFCLYFWETIGDTDLGKLAEELREAAEIRGTVITALNLFGNPLSGDETGDVTWKNTVELVRRAKDFGCSLVGCFTGRIPGASVPDSLEAWKKLYSPLIEEAEKLGVRIVFENCRFADTWKSGKWNIAINPDAWELMFQAVPSQTIGLEWEPCHQIQSLADPYAQLKEWLPRIFHIHGKDARVDRKLLAGRGLYGVKHWAASCFPGEGDADWKTIFAILRQGGYTGSVDIEGWNDKEWSGEKEIEGQRRALEYLRHCRGQAAS